MSDWQSEDDTLTESIDLRPCSTATTNKRIHLTKQRCRPHRYELRLCREPILVSEDVENFVTVQRLPAQPKQCAEFALMSGTIADCPINIVPAFIDAESPKTIRW